MLSRHSIGTASVPAGRNIWTHLTGDQCSHGGGRDHLRQRPAAAPRAVYLLLLQGKWPCMVENGIEVFSACLSSCHGGTLRTRRRKKRCCPPQLPAACASTTRCIMLVTLRCRSEVRSVATLRTKIELATGMSHPCSLHVWLSAIHDVFMQFCVTWASFSDCFAQILCCNRHWSVWFGLLPRQIWLRRLFPLKSRPVRTHLVRSSSPV